MTLADSKPKLVAVVGPTASGKTGLAVAIAKKFNGQLISADSRQIYKGANIGTAKDRNFPHQLIDILSLDEQFSVASYRELAIEKITQISADSRLPILVGGSGQYIEAVLYEKTFPQVQPSARLRSRLEKLTVENLYQQLKILDPVRVRTIDQHNKRRLIRAIEIVKLTGRAVPKINKNPFFNSLVLGLKREKSELKNLISRRFDSWLKNGLIDEIVRLRQQFGSDPLERLGLHYRLGLDFLDSRISLAEYSRKSKSIIYRYACSQKAWWAKREVIWVNSPDQAIKRVEKFLRSD